MKILNSGTVFFGAEGTRTCGNYIPSVLAMSSGEILACHRTGSGKLTSDGQIAVMISGDKGETFCEAFYPFDNVYKGVKGSFWSAYPAQLSGDEITTVVFWVDKETYGDVDYFNNETYGLLPVKTLVYKSCDFGRNWQLKGEIDKSPFECQLPVTNHIYKFSDGTLLCPFENYKNYYDNQPWKQAAVVKFSYDGGKSWDDYAMAAHDENMKLWYNDQRGCVLQDGGLINYYPTFDTQKKEYINVYMNSSHDKGKTWSKPSDTEIAGMPSSPAPLPDGAIVISTSDQKSKTVDIFKSHDGGKSFGDEMLTIYSAEFDKSKRKEKNYTDWVDWSFGRPQISKINDSEIFVVYYAGNVQCTDIRWALCEV